MVQVGSSIFVVLPEEVEAFLPVVGIRTAVCQEIARIGEEARDRCTPNHPPSAPGFYAWSEWNRALRDFTGIDGWSSSDEDNLSRVISPDGRIAITVSSGGSGTGVPGSTPSTAHPKGNATKEAIQANQTSLNLTPGVVSLPTRRGPTTWILLIDRRPGPRGTDMIYLELSCPGSITEAGFIVTWAPRYILPPVDFSLPPGGGRSERDEDDGELDVPVTRR